MLELTFDLVLALTLVGLCGRLLTTDDLFESIVLFVVFGLLMALTWSRLGAVDIALAEAAIGAGITGAMLMNARCDSNEARNLAPPCRPNLHLAAAIAALAFFVVLVWAFGTVAPESTGLRDPALGALEASGVQNPVTAVLLNVRAWDTVLELTLLLLAVVGVWSLRLPDAASIRARPGPVLLAAMRLLVPISLVVGGYLLWLGTHAPGGAFQAAAVVAGAGVLYELAEHRDSKRERAWPRRVGLGAGVLAFVAVGVAAMLRGETFLFHRHATATTVIVVIELFATLSIALGLVALFSGRAPATRAREDT